MHGLPSNPPHPSFQGGDEITEIPSSELERPITEGIKSQGRQPDRRERDQGNRRETAGQTEPQEISQTNRETQITSSCEEEGGEAHPTLDLDGEVEMQVEDEGGAELQHSNRLEDIDEPTLPTLEHENEIDMQEGVTGVKRGQPECVDNPCNGKLRRREGIKRSLRDIALVNYEEYDTSWDLEDQSKRCKRVVNCLLASCKCKAESEPIRNKSGVMPVHLVPDTGGAGQAGWDQRHGRDGTASLATRPQ